MQGGRLDRGLWTSPGKRLDCAVELLRGYPGGLATEQQVEHFIGRWQDQFAGDFSFEKAAEWQSAKIKTAGQQAEILREVARFNEQKSKAARVIFGFDALVITDDDEKDGASFERSQRRHARHPILAVGGWNDLGEMIACAVEVVGARWQPRWFECDKIEFECLQAASRWNRAALAVCVNAVSQGEKPAEDAFGRHRGGKSVCGASSYE